MIANTRQSEVQVMPVQLYSCKTFSFYTIIKCIKLNYDDCDILYRPTVERKVFKFFLNAADT